MKHHKEQPFYPLNEYPEFKTLIAQAPLILEDLNNNDFWMNWGSDDYDPKGHCQFLEGGWTICPVYFGNYDPRSINIPNLSDDHCDELIASLPVRFPHITSVLKSQRRINFAAFSRLHPQSELALHTHVNPFSLILHLGLVIPEGKKCGLQVGNKTHIWKKQGDLVIFNDNLPHGAWNHSDEERILLYVDFARHLTLEEENDLLD